MNTKSNPGTGGIALCTLSSRGVRVGGPRVLNRPAIEPFSISLVACSCAAASLNLPTPPPAFQAATTDASQGLNFASGGASALDILQQVR